MPQLGATMKFIANPYRGGFCPGKLTLEKILPVKNSVPELKNGGKNSVPLLGVWNGKKEIQREAPKKTGFFTWLQLCWLSPSTGGLPPPPKLGGPHLNMVDGSVIKAWQRLLYPGN